MSARLGPRGEGQERRSGLDARGAQDGHGFDLVGHGVALVELCEHVRRWPTRRPTRRTSIRPRASAGHRSRWRRTCSTLAVTSKVRSGKAPCTASTTRAAWCGSVQEVGVAEGDVARPHGDELGHVGHHGVLAHQAGAPVVDDRHGAVATAVGAAVAGFDVAGQARFAADGQRGRSARGAGGGGGPAARSVPARATRRRTAVRGATGVAAGRGRRPRPRGPARTRPAMWVRHRGGHPRAAVEAGVQAVQAQRQRPGGGDGSRRTRRGPGAWRCASAPNTPPRRPTTRLVVERVDRQVRRRARRARRAAARRPATATCSG